MGKNTKKFQDTNWSILNSTHNILFQYLEAGLLRNPLLFLAEQKIFPTIKVI